MAKVMLLRDKRKKKLENKGEENDVKIKVGLSVTKCTKTIHSFRQNLKGHLMTHLPH